MRSINDSVFRYVNSISSPTPHHQRPARQAVNMFVMTIALLLCGVCFGQEESAAPSATNDSSVTTGDAPQADDSAGLWQDHTAIALRSVMPGVDTSLPATLFPVEKLRKTWQELANDPALQQKAQTARNRADKYLEIPAEKWEQLIPDRSPAPINKILEPGSSHYFIDCPLTGARLQQLFAPFDIIGAPFSITAISNGEVIHELPQDRTPEEQARIGGQTSFMHWDGKERVLDYVDNPAVVREGQTLRYYPANYVWRARLMNIVGDWNGGVIPNLADAYLATGDEKYAAALILVLKRLATVFPHFPLAFHNGVDPRTRQEFLAMAAKHEPVGSHGWLGPARLNAAGENFRPPMEGTYTYNIARAFMAIEHAASWGSTSEEANANREFVRENLLHELSYLFSSYGAKNCVGNGIGMYAPGLIGLGIALQDKYFVNGFHKIIEDFLYTEAYYDGISTEGSLNYAGMIGGMYQLWQLRQKYDPDCLKKHPFFAICGRSQEYLRSQCGAMSQHGDGPNQAWLISPSMIARADSQQGAATPSQTYSGFGITVLRAGTAGKRMEVFFHHDRATGHAHPDMLGLQLHYRGIPVLNHLGDARLGRFIELQDSKNQNAAFLKGLQYPQMMRSTEDLENYPDWSWGMHASLLTKNTMTVDEYDYGFARAPWRGGFGEAKEPFGNLRLAVLDDPTFQVAEADGVGVAPLHYQGVRGFNRKLLAITRPDGSPYLVDIFTAVGGNRKMLLWHCAGEVIESAEADNAKTVTNDTLGHWLDQTFPDRNEWIPPTCQLRATEYFHNIHAQENPAREWKQTWKLDYARYCPKTAPIGQTAITENEWRQRGVQPVKLDLRGIALPGEYDNWIIQANSDYPAIITEYAQENKLSGMVRFIDGLNYVGTMRAYSQRSSTTFAHVLEPYQDGTDSAISRVQPLSPRSGDHILPNGAAGLRVVFKDGTVDLIAALPEGTGEYTFAEGLSVDGRFALVRLDLAGNITDWRLIGGRSLRWKDTTLIGDGLPMANGIITDTEGDLNGNRSQSVLIVKAKGVWPELSSLTGKLINVAYNRGHRIENYEIASATLQDDSIRIVLKNAPPFVDVWGEVVEMYAGNRFPGSPQTPSEFIGTPAYKGGMFSTSYMDGSIIAFPEIGVSLPLRTGETRTWRFDLGVDVDLAKLGVKPGMVYAVYPDITSATIRVLHTETP